MADQNKDKELIDDQYPSDDELVRAPYSPEDSISSAEWEKGGGDKRAELTPEEKFKAETDEFFNAIRHHQQLKNVGLSVEPTFVKTSGGGYWQSELTEQGREFFRQRAKDAENEAASVYDPPIADRAATFRSDYRTGEGWRIDRNPFEHPRDWHSLYGPGAEYYDDGLGHWGRSTIELDHKEKATDEAEEYVYDQEVKERIRERGRYLEENIESFREWGNTTEGQAYIDTFFPDAKTVEDVINKLGNVSDLDRIERRVLGWQAREAALGLERRLQQQEFISTHKDTFANNTTKDAIISVFGQSGFDLLAQGKIDEFRQLSDEHKAFASLFGALNFSDNNPDPNLNFVVGQVWGGKEAGLGLSVFKEGERTNIRGGKKEFFLDFSTVSESTRELWLNFMAQAAMGSSSQEELNRLQNQAFEATLADENVSDADKEYIRERYATEESFISGRFIEDFEGDNKLTDEQLITKYGSPRQKSSGITQLGAVGRRRLRDDIGYMANLIRLKRTGTRKLPSPGGAGGSKSSTLVVPMAAGATVGAGSKTTHVARQVVSINGQPTSVISSNQSSSLAPRDWDQLLRDDMTSPQALEVKQTLEDTMNAIGDIDTPAARQLSELWGAATRDEESLRAATNLTDAERSQASDAIRRRKAEIASRIPSVGNIGERQEAQEMAAERAELAEGRKAAADRISNFEDAYKTTKARATQQANDTGVPVTDTQFMQMFNDEVQSRNEAAQFVRQFAKNGVIPEPPAEEPSEAPPKLSNPHGGFVYTQQDGKPYARVEGTGPSGPLIPVRFLGEVGYPSPANEAQIAALPKGSIYFAPGENKLSSKDTGNLAPNQLAHLQTEKELAERTVFAEKTADQIHVEQSDTFFKYDTEYLPESIAAYNSARIATSNETELPDITPAMVYDGSAAALLSPHMGTLINQLELRPQDLSNLLTPALDPNSAAGRQARRDALQRRLEIRQESRDTVRQYEIDNELRAAPYQNTIASFEQSIIGDNDAVIYTDPRSGMRKAFEAYTVSQKDSLFYGKSLPVLRDSNDLLEIDPSMWTNMAYYNPTAGRVLASIAPKGSQMGEYTAEQFDGFINDIAKLFPEDFFVSTEHAKAVFDEFTKHMGFTGPAN